MQIHQNFRLNGKTFAEEDLLEIAYSLKKEGAPLEKSIGDFFTDWLSESPFIEVRTSGSTGTPKKIQLRKEHMVNSALATGKFFNLERNDSALLCLSADYIAGKMMLVRAMVLGLQLDFVAPSSNPLENLQKQYDFCAMVPLQAESSCENIHQLKTLLIGGAPVSNSLKEKLQGCSSQVFETYGMTETITHIAAKSIESDSFKTLPGITISKDDRDCLVIDAPQISDAQVVTNDVVNILSKNSFQWLGRFDNVINSGGIKLIPEVIEKKLSNLIKNRFFVTGLPDDILGEKLVLIVEGQPAKESLLKSIREAKFLDKYEIPKEVLNIDGFIETASGKIDRLRTLSNGM